MNLFYRRPLLLALFCFLTISVLCAFTSAKIRYFCLFAAFLLSLLLLVILVFCKCLRKTDCYCIVNALLCTIFCFVAILSSHLFFDRTLAVAENYSTPVTMVAEIKECTFSAPYNTTYIAKVETIDDEKQNFSVSLTTETACDLTRGNRI